MRWTLRNQILMPFLLLQLVLVAAVAVCSAWFAVQRVETELTQRLTGMLTVLRESSYPLTPVILEQLRQLSGAELAVLDREGELRGTTLVPLRTWGDRAELREVMWAGPEFVPRRSRIRIANEGYFAGKVVRDGVSDEIVIGMFPEVTWQHARQRAMLPPFVVGGLLLLPMVLVSVAIARRLGRRVYSLQQQVARIAQGDFRPAALPAGHDELRDLSRDVNRMAVVLEGAQRQMRDAERSSLLTQLVSGVAHQLRNSLTGARTAVQLHQRHCRTSQDEALAVALRQLTLTEEHIKSLLRLARHEHRPPQPAEIGAIVDEVAALMAPICTHHHIRFDCERCDGLHQIDDGDALRAALLNLLTNAVEASRPGGHVALRIVWEAAGVVIDVTDDGPGIAENLPQDVFAPFFSTKPEGSGLGLAIARQAAEDCRGKLTLHCRQQPTVFRLVLPFHPADA